MINLKKIKFPFKKIKYVCTTDQVVHQVDGKDKKLSEILSSEGSDIADIDIYFATPNDVSNIFISGEPFTEIELLEDNAEPTTTIWAYKSQLDKALDARYMVVRLDTVLTGNDMQLLGNSSLHSTDVIQGMASVQSVICLLGDPYFFAFMYSPEQEKASISLTTFQ